MPKGTKRAKPKPLEPKPLTPLQALKGLVGAVEGISGYWDESVANWMQEAEGVLKQSSRRAL